MGVKWNQNKENYNVTTTCGKRAARLEGTCGDATGRLAACDFLERPRQSSTITSSSNLHHIWYATTTFSLDKGLHAGPRELPSRAPFGTQRSLMSFNHLFTILSYSFWFFICYILFISVPYQAMICGSCGSVVISCARFLGSGDGFGWKSALELCRLHQFLPGA